MALQTAASAKVATDGAKDPSDYETLTAILVDAEITRVRATQYYANFSLDIKKDGNVPMIKQSDNSLLDIDELLVAIRAKGYSASATINGAYVELRVVWE